MRRVSLSGFVLAGFLMVLMVAAASCKTAETRTADVALSEFSVDSVSSIDAGPVELSVVNEGEFPHTLVITKASGEVVSAIDPIQSGQTVDMALDLEPGAYEFTCRIVTQSGDGVLFDHYERGMVANVTVEG